MVTGAITYRRIMNATKSEIDMFLNSYGYKDLKMYSREYIALLFKSKAKSRQADYFI